MNKEDLRKLYLKKRHDLHPDKVERLSLSVLENFSSLSFNGIQYIHIFYPIKSKHEFNSLLLADWIRTYHPEIKLVLPKSNFQDQTLTNILWTSETLLSVNRWGITEPEDGLKIAPQDIDMVIIPLLAFDKQGNRLGYGKGFYDRFLATCRPEVEKLGISLFEPEEAFEEVDLNDVPLTSCITPKGIWKF